MDNEKKKEPEVLLSVSVVLFKHNSSYITSIIKSLLTTKQKLNIILFDNTPLEYSLDWEFTNLKEIKDFQEHHTIHYHRSDSNLGFGKGHNRAVQLLKEGGLLSKYHLIMNPDIIIEKTLSPQNPDPLSFCTNFLENENHKNVALVIPTILNTDLTLQYVNKRVPSPIIFFLRKFFYHTTIPLFRYHLDHYELKDYPLHDLPHPLLCPIISGCFMLVRSSVFLEVGGFDERFFLHFEDSDLSRSINLKYDSLILPQIKVIHEWGRDTHKSIKGLVITLISAYQYFSKWGWFNSKERVQLNKKVRYLLP